VRHRDRHRLRLHPELPSRPPARRARQGTSSASRPRSTTWPRWPIPPPPRPWSAAARIAHLSPAATLSQATRRDD